MRAYINTTDNPTSKSQLWKAKCVLCGRGAAWRDRKRAACVSFERFSLWKFRSLLRPGARRRARAVLRPEALSEGKTRYDGSSWRKSGDFNRLIRSSAAPPQS